MKKKLLFFVILLLSINVWATDFTVGGVAYSISNTSLKTVSIGTGSTTPAINKSTSGNFSIPASISSGGITYAVTSIGPYAFYGCSKLTSVTIPNSIIRITSSVFEDCSSLTSIVLPNSVVSLGGSAFLSCTSLTSITFSNSLTTIGGGAFQNCPKLISLNLPKSLTTIGNYAFYYCTGLYSVTIPDAVTSIGEGAFSECSKLYSFYIKKANPASITMGAGIFNASPVSSGILYVPSGTKPTYQAASQWSAFATIAEEGQNALHFDGKNDYVSIPSVATNLSTFTIEMWIKPTTVPTTGDIALLNTNSWDNANGSSVHFQLEGSKVIISVYGLSADWPSSKYTPIVGKWQHIVVTYDRPNSAVKFYVNSFLVSTVNKSLPVAKIDAACIGAWGGTQRFFNGAIDEVRIWNTVRSEEEIIDNKSIPLSNPATLPGLLAYYDFNQGVADYNNTYIPALFDGSALRVNGTLKNFALLGPSSNFVKGFPVLSLSATTASVAASEGSSATINITSTTDWSAASNQSWLTVSPTSGTDDGVLTFTATGNPTTSTRTATVTVIGTGVSYQTITVTQDASPASLLLSSIGTSVISAEANTRLIEDVTSNTDWTAASDQQWLTVSPISGKGNGQFTLTAAANTSFSPRTAIITVVATAVNGQITTTATQTFSVKQVAGATNLSLVETTTSIGARDNSYATVDVITNAICTVTSDQTWLTASFNKVADRSWIFLTAAANPTSAKRTAKVTVSAPGADSQILTVIQDAMPANLSLSSTTVNIGAIANSTANIDVVSNIAWTAASDQSWLAVSPASATGNGKLTFTATANPTTSTRTATVTVSGTGVQNQTITVTQDVATLSLSASSIFIGAADNSSRTVNVSSNVGWTASSDQTWLAVHPASQSGNGTLTLTAAGNTGAVTRVATVTVSIAGITSQTVTVTQNAGEMTLSLSAYTASIGATGNSTVTVDATSNTGWIATSDQSWLAVSPASGTGNGTLTIKATANPTISTRTATVTVTATAVNGTVTTTRIKKITVTQDAGEASLSLSATSVAIGVASNSETAVNVTSNIGWTATSDQSWLAVSPASGTGNGTLTFKATANTATSTRTATVTVSATGVSKQIITVTQDAGKASLSLSATSVAIGASSNSETAVNVTSNTGWTASSDQSWLAVSPASGTGNGVLTFTATANPTTLTRTATVTVSGTDISNQTITVTQAGGVNTGVEVPNKEAITLYPNPISNGFVIRVGEQKSLLSIYDLSGNLVLSEQITGKSYIDITSLPVGIYLVKANGMVGKLIKK